MAFFFLTCFFLFDFLFPFFLKKKAGNKKRKKVGSIDPTFHQVKRGSCPLILLIGDTLTVNGLIHVCEKRLCSHTSHNIPFYKKSEKKKKKHTRLHSRKGKGNARFRLGLYLCVPKTVVHVCLFRYGGYYRLASTPQMHRDETRGGSKKKAKKKKNRKKNNNHNAIRHEAS